MTAQSEAAVAASPLTDGEEENEGASGDAYAISPSQQPEPVSTTRPLTPRPSHYKVICISLYTEDLTRLDGMVEDLKKRGITKANRSALIRYALEQVDLEKVPRGL